MAVSNLTTIIQRSVCVGERGLDEWTDDWNNGTCSDLYHNLLLVNNDGSPGYNPGNLTLVQDDFFEAFRFLLINQDDIQDPPTESQTDLLNACLSTPGMCDEALDNFCPTKTREEIINSEQLLAFCGCHAPPNPILSGVDPQCDPLCNQIGTIPLQDPNTGLVLRCDASVCVINNVTLQPGQGSITQMCSGCTDAQPCKCFISNVPEGLDVSMCSSDSVCFKSDENGIPMPVDCSTVINTTTEEQTFSINLAAIIIAGIIILVMILFIILYPIFKKKKIE
uniref:Transmembrane protein n=1 Tax=Pithovirus LCPAC403 TaxID=2506596 RepID=A0A481ZBB5_9VIRU|nr:MAG: transmembrane protein [Pithovirus LCPAC403]